tara:strand:+ start:2126 stop:2293 length:168 start_codon:yes stop_codon:yes gene_type:complete
MEGILPSNLDEPKKEKKVNEAILSVWDVDAKGWRSFRMDTITQVRHIVLQGGANA